MKFTFDLSAAEWVASRHSSGNGGQCVEFARNLAASCGAVPVRDSKAPERPALAFPVRGWADFVAAVADGRLGARHP
ncbi:DUF397 domain-containing protein [Streptomyces hoynatensis]|uniref:DUF397 domain-containing protein n=1 Tax=Streptomyces hoynatensis TaxID=1141874 RepID=A0A3A9Z3Z3_9ACTN|nr:DUF397 domain-containing protein [Streptomyces hoynatensis]RKN43151.1 DUF397 domain-containing protein [Streptomyces hoynatensis]